MFQRLIVPLALRSLLLAMVIAGIVCIFAALVSWESQKDFEEDQIAIQHLSLQK